MLKKRLKNAKKPLKTVKKTHQFLCNSESGGTGGEIRGILRDIVGGFAAGAVSGFAGAGGGTVIYMMHSDKRADRTVGITVMLVGVFSAVGALFRGGGFAPNVKDILFAIAGAAAGAITGCCAGKGISPAMLRGLFAALTFISGVSFICR